MNDALTAAKAKLRKQCFAARKTAHEQRAVKTAPANQNLIDALSAQCGDLSGRIVAIYRPMRTELSPDIAAEALLAAGARLCVPVIKANGEPLLFREWTPNAAMEPGAFGADIPRDGEWLTPDVVIAPLVGWDRNRGRLGYGGGFYDRTLEQLRAIKPTPAIGFAYAAQELPEAPQEPTDQPLDALVTEQEIVSFTNGDQR